MPMRRPASLLLTHIRRRQCRPISMQQLMRCALRTARLSSAARGGSMKRREFILVLGCAAAWPPMVRAQDRIIRSIGILETISPELNAANAPAVVTLT